MSCKFIGFLELFPSICQMSYSLKCRLHVKTKNLNVILLLSVMKHNKYNEVSKTFVIYWQSFMLTDYIITLIVLSY